MAQYFQVVNQADTEAENDVQESPQFYSRESSNVQYVITTEAHQPGNQQIVVSGEQFMLLDGQRQKLILDQSSIAFQSRTDQYIVEEGAELRPAQPQVYYMDSSRSDGNLVPLQQQTVIPLQQSTIVQTQAQNVVPMQTQTVVPMQQRSVQQTQQHIVQTSAGGSVQQLQSSPIVLNHQLPAPRTQLLSSRGTKLTLTGTAEQVLAQLKQTGPSRITLTQQKLPVHQANAQRFAILQKSQQQINPTQMPSQAPLQQMPVMKKPQQIPLKVSSQSQMPLRQQIQMQLLTQQQQQQQQQIQNSSILQSQVPQQQLQQQQHLQQHAQMRNQPQVRQAGALPQQRIVSGSLSNVVARPTPSQNEVESSEGFRIQTPFQNQQFPVSDESDHDQEAISPDSSVITLTNLPPGINIKKAEPSGAVRKKPAAPRKPRNPKPPAEPKQPRAPKQANPNARSRAKQPKKEPEIGFGPDSSARKDQPPPPALKPITQKAQPEAPQQRASQAQYLIQPNASRRKANPLTPLPSFIRSSQIQQIIESTPVCEEYSDSIRMLVLLQNGEQRLITFTLPKEACTIQEILEQVNVPFQSDTDIRVTEINSNGIHYLVTVGAFPLLNEAEDQHNGDLQPLQSDSKQPFDDHEAPTRESTPEPPKEQPRYEQGKLAVCINCGYLSEDFNRCCRCKRKLPDNVKSIAGTGQFAKELEKRMASSKANAANGAAGSKSPGLSASSIHQVQQQLQAAQQQQNALKKRKKIVDHEPVVLTLSSDDEETEPAAAANPIKSVSEQLLEKLGSSISLHPIQKEPSINDIKKNSGIKEDSQKGLNATDKVISLFCRTVRIGSYKFVPQDDVVINSSKISFKAPHLKNSKDLKLIIIEQKKVVKVLVCFDKDLPVVFIYVLQSVAEDMRKLLGMGKGSDVYFDPVSEVECHKRITLLPECLTQDIRAIFIELYGKPSALLDELNAKEANEILIKTCKDFNKVNLQLRSCTDLLTYPPEGRVRIPINTEDYMCLAQDQFLNDVIIDFYIKYTVDNLPKEKQDKVHAFSTFFYKRLTTKPVKASRKLQPSELDPNLSAAEKRHARVKTWTKHVNLFEKDFIIVPINENCHWFLAIICFPMMDGPHTFEGVPVKIEPRTKRKKTTGSSSSAASPEKGEKSILCEEGDISDKDEAEGDESELESDGSEDLPSSQNSTSSNPENASASSASITSNNSNNSNQKPVEVNQSNKKVPIRQPCILLFDSLGGAGRSRVVATLRDYLTCEFKAKMNDEKVFTKDVIKGSCVKVPQQTNFTDCGLYVLQYVEHFFKVPIKDYSLPIKELKNWFEEIIVTKKREDISLLIKDLMTLYNKDVSVLPDMIFPTQNGKLLEQLHTEEEEEEMDEMDEDEDFSCKDSHPDMDEFMDDMDEEEEINGQEEELLMESVPALKPCEDLKPTRDSVSSGSVQAIKTQNVLRPDISELPRPTTDRTTLNLLKAKRIVRPRNVSGEGPEVKKSKVMD